MCWLDLEMTGLEPEKDVILEIGALVTDSNLNVIAQGPNLVISQPIEKLNNLNEWVLKTHTDSGLLDAVKQSSISLQQAEEQVLDFFQQYCVAQASPLCGNTIWQDRRFLIKYMPTLNNFFHYRNIDVSTVKELVHTWYNFKYKKTAPHRALDDIKQSVEELNYYRQHYFIKGIK